jgi:hypothetical protein
MSLRIFASFIGSTIVRAGVLEKATFGATRQGAQRAPLFQEAPAIF